MTGLGGRERRARWYNRGVIHSKGGKVPVREERVRRPAVAGRWRPGQLGALTGWFLAGALISVLPAHGQFGPPPDVPVVVVQVAERPVRDEVTFIGSVEPDRAVTVQAEVAGRVARTEPREGEPVVGGQTVIAELDRTPNELSSKEARATATKARQEWEKLARGYRQEEIDEARQNVARAEARVRDLEAGARPQEREQARSAVGEAEARRILAEREFRRMEQLASQGLVAAQERDRAWQAYEVAKSQERAAREQVELVEAGTRPEQIEVARAEVRQAQQRLKLLEAGPRAEEIAQAEAEYRRATFTVERLEDELRRMRIVAPLTGFLVRKRVEVGAWLKPGDAVVDLIALDPVYVVGPVSERDVGRLTRGARARVALDAYPDRTFSGEVAHIVPQADPQSRAFPVKVRVRNPDHLLKSGMFARVALEIPGNRKAIYVPKDAVVRRDNASVVYVVEDGVAKARVVRTGQAAGELIEVMDGAVTSGQEVVVIGNDALRDGAKVRKVGAGGSGPGQPMKGR
jgi:HlyD family secretion protein